MAVRHRKYTAETLCPRRPGAAFTLVELLVVVAIIAVLASLLLPAIMHARYAARRVRCAMNLKSVGMSAIVYANDFDGEFPPHKDNSSSWPWGFSDWGMQKSNFYRDYLSRKEVFFCPEDLANGRNSEASRCYPHFPSKSPDAWRVDISYNYFYGRDAWHPEKANKRQGEISLDDVTEPSRSTILADVMRFSKSPPYDQITNWNHISHSGGGSSPLDRAGGNMFFVDGHAAWLSGREELLAHRQKMKNNDRKSYCAIQPHDY